MIRNLHFHHSQKHDATWHTLFERTDLQESRSVTIIIDMRMLLVPVDILQDVAGVTPIEQFQHLEKNEVLKKTWI